MYMKLLEQTVRELKGEELEDDVRATVNLRVDLRIDESYVPDMNQRLMLYRKVAAARRDEEIDRVLEEAADRYGPLPDSVLNLADYGRIRVMADRLGIDTIDREGRTVVLKFRPQAKVDPVRLVSLVRQRPDLTLVPPAALKLNLDGIRDSSELERLAAVAAPGTRSQRDHQERRRPPELVDGAGARRRGQAGFHEGRDPAARQGGSARARRRVRAGRRLVERAARSGVKYSVANELRMN